MKIQKHVYITAVLLLFGCSMIFGQEWKNYRDKTFDENLNALAKEIDSTTLDGDSYYDGSFSYITFNDIDTSIFTVNFGGRVSLPLFSLFYIDDKTTIDTNIKLLIRINKGKAVTVRGTRSIVNNRIVIGRNSGWTVDLYQELIDLVYSDGGTLMISTYDIYTKDRILKFDIPSY